MPCELSASSGEDGAGERWHLRLRYRGVGGIESLLFVFVVDSRRASWLVSMSEGKVLQLLKETLR